MGAAARDSVIGGGRPRIRARGQVRATWAGGGARGVWGLQVGTRGAARGGAARGGAGGRGVVRERAGRGRAGPCGRARGGAGARGAAERAAGRA